MIEESLTRPEAFETIFGRHYDAIFRYLARRVGAGAAGDLASEVFTVAFAARDRFRPEEANARPWLYGIAANLARRHARTARRHRRAGQRTIGGTSVWLDPPAEDRIDAAAMRDVLVAAIDGLRTAEREVLLMYALTDLTYDEVARALGIPVGTVRSRLARARGRLRESLLQHGHREPAAQLTEGDEDVR